MCARTLNCIMESLCYIGKLLSSNMFEFFEMNELLLDCRQNAYRLNVAKCSLGH